jgi:hypothetical protein
MDAQDRETGWEDVGSQNAVASSMMGSGEPSMQMPMGPMGTMQSGGNFSNAMTGAMVDHFAREFTRGSLSLWPQMVTNMRRYFNVHHGYVLRKLLWQLCPLPMAKMKGGELGLDKDWTVRIFEGLEVGLEEPDMYIPLMAFVTYVLLCGLVKGLHDMFHPDVLASTLSFAMTLLVAEVLCAKAGFFVSVAIQAPVLDLTALLGYKYYYLSLQLLVGFAIGEGSVYYVLKIALWAGCAAALWQSMRRLPSVQQKYGQECVSDLHKIFIRVFPVTQVALCWLLAPTFPRQIATAAAAQVAEAVVEVGSANVEAVVSTTLQAVTEAMNHTGRTEG